VCHHVPSLHFFCHIFYVFLRITYFLRYCGKSSSKRNVINSNYFLLGWNRRS